MADLPILFSGPMVRANLDGRKTQTRRILSAHNLRIWTGGLDYAGRYAKLSKEDFAQAMDGACDFRLLDGGQLVWMARNQFTGELAPASGRLIYAAGDRLWVRESGIEMTGLPGGAGDLFRHDVPATPESGVYWSRNNGGPGASYFVAGCSRASHLTGKNKKVRPSIHMPRWASRLTLPVSQVRVEPLQDISEADAIAEGLEWCVPGKWSVAPNIPIIGSDPRKVYGEFWDYINGPGAWDANPWVVAVTYSVGRYNIDAGMADG